MKRLKTHDESGKELCFSWTMWTMGCTMGCTMGWSLGWILEWTQGWILEERRGRAWVLTTAFPSPVVEDEVEALEPGDEEEFDEEERKPSSC